MTTSFSPSKLVVYWLWSGIILILTIVVIGGMTRLTHSGLSMVHWTFTGSLPPMTDAAWETEFQKYRTSPEFKELHNHFNLSDFQSIFWWEFIHRLFGRMLGLVFLIPFAIFWFKKMIPKAMLPQFFVLFGLGAFQGFLGWFMVQSGLVDVPRVSHFRLAAHLTTAFITCSYIFWLMQQFEGYSTLNKNVAPERKLVLVFGGLLLLQIVYGAFVAGLKAGWVHNTWPLMDGHIVAEAVTIMKPWVVNFLEGKSGVQFIHRTLGIVVLCYAIWMGFISKSFKHDRFGTYPKLLASAVVLQFILGVTTLLFHVPISLAVIHQVFALVTLLCLMGLLHNTSFTKG